MDDLRSKLKEMIVRALMLEGVEPADIGDEDRLFGGELGLDSVDAAELAIHIEDVFGVRIGDDPAGREAFRSVATLAAWIEARRGGA